MGLGLAAMLDLIALLRQTQKQRVGLWLRYSCSNCRYLDGPGVPASSRRER